MVTKWIFKTLDLRMEDRRKDCSKGINQEATALAQAGVNEGLK